MATMLTGDGILDDVMSLIPDSDTTLRTKMLIWLNYIVAKVAFDLIEWDCLRKLASLAVSSNQITLPADFSSLISISQSGIFYLNRNDEVVDRAEYDATQWGTGTTPEAYARDTVTGKLTFYPGASGTVSLRYIAEPATIADTTTATVWPMQFKNLFLRACIDFYYEYDMDTRAAMSYQLDQAEYARLVEWELSKRPLPVADKKGLLRRR